MSNRYEISIGDLLVEPPAAVGKFAVTFVIKPPLEIISGQAGSDLGSHILDTLNALQYDENQLEETRPGTQSSHAKVSFTHRSPDGEATLGTISGFSRQRIDTGLLSRALNIVLNGNQE